jgi:methionyl-tRNA formyltransferase
MADFILLAKQDAFSRQAALIARLLFGDRLETFDGAVGDPLPDRLAEARPQALISFLSPWIVPQQLLDNSALAINFHPASTDYPGIGCYNFALYEEASDYGAVCHHMLAKVDTGAIVEERRFPVFAWDSVESLKLRTMVTMLAMFHDLCSLLAAGRPLPASDAAWSRRPFTRRQMNDLRRIDAAMDPGEIARRVRAMTYPGYPGPSVTLGDTIFYHPVPDRPPFA